MAVEVTQKYVAPSRIPFVNLRWGAVFAGLAVGISTNLFLLLIGAAAGLAVFNPSEPPSGEGIVIAASIWDTLSMLAGAFVGGYVAARASGMRRSRDGILHGAVAWGVTMILSAILAGSAAGATLAGMFSAISGRSDEVATAAGAARTGDREATLGVLQQRLGLTPEQANNIVDQAMVLSGRPESASEQSKEDTRAAMRTASLASGWLSAAIVLSLLAAMGGGLLGARGARRLGGPELRRQAIHTEDISEGTHPHIPI